MTALTYHLSTIVRHAFEEHGLAPELGDVRVSERPDLAQFQCNGAMAAAKHAKRNPREIAQAVVSVLGRQDIFAKIEIAGPGFINLDVTDDFIAQRLQAFDPQSLSAKGQEQTVMVDYGGPNIAKPMHVGHLRSSIIGDSIRRMFVFAGYRTLGDVHLGDWGLQMGQVLSELEIRGQVGQSLTIEDLEEIYPAAAQACKEDETRKEQARAATVKLQKGDETYRAAWRQFVDVSIAGMKKNFDALGVHFDLWEGEASVHDAIAPMVENLKDKAVAVESEGAWVVPIAQNDDKKQMPPLILYKSDGAVMYGTTDLATVLERVRLYDPSKLIYVVDQRQALHFEQVFRAARKADIAPDNLELIHAGFGTMNGPDGKPFKTREGGVMRLEDLIAMASEKAQKRLAEADLAQDMNEAERADIAHKVGIAALKFADLQNQRQSDYVFDIDQMTAFEGKTGPYLLYQAVRIQSLLDKAAAQGIEVSENMELVISEGDRDLALHLLEFGSYFETALEAYTPHILCEYVYKLAQSFSSFYGSCHILSESDEALRQSRLALCALTRRQLVLTLDLLGIQVPQRM